MAGNQVAVLTRSQHWNSILKRWLTQEPIHWLFQLGELTGDLQEDPPQVAIIELVEETLEQDCLAVFEKKTLGWETKLFAVADSEMAFWLPLIRSCGFLHLATENSGHNRMREIVNTYMKSLTSPTIDIEQRVAMELPWSPLRGDAVVDS